MVTATAQASPRPAPARRPIVSPVSVRPPAGLIQANGFFSDLWASITSYCCPSNNYKPVPQGEKKQKEEKKDTEEKKEKEEKKIKVTGSNHTVAQNVYMTLIPGDSYTSTQLTGCAIVFALSSAGSCVYHWPGHDPESSSYNGKMATAMDDAFVGKDAQFKIFGYHRPISGESEIDLKCLKGWQEFGEKVGQMGKSAEVFLGPSDQPIFIYDGKTVTCVQSVESLPTHLSKIKT